MQNTEAFLTLLSTLSYACNEGGGGSVRKIFLSLSSTYFQQSRHDLPHVRLHGVGRLFLHQLGEHLDGGLVDGEVSGLDDGVEHPHHHLGREQA